MITDPIRQIAHPIRPNGPNSSFRNIAASTALKSARFQGIPTYCKRRTYGQSEAYIFILNHPTYVTCTQVESALGSNVSLSYVNANELMKSIGSFSRPCGI